MQSETRNCQNCKKDFIIEPDDFGFYEKIKVPPPTFCPECRSQRRLAWRNNMSLYSRKCDLCQKSIVALYSLTSNILVYCNKCWWSDKWDPKSYAVDYNFSKSFFTQYIELIKKVPHSATVNDDGIASLNCEYSHDTWFAKNCYMTFYSWHIENVMYSTYMVGGSKDMMDCLNIMKQSQWQYECINCDSSYQLKNSQFCLSCVESNFLYDCRDCSNCFMCFGLRSKKYYFKNKQYKKEDYKKILNEYKLYTFLGIEKAQEEFDSFIVNYPRRFCYMFKSLNCTGDLLFNGKNSKYCFSIQAPENCRYIDNGDAPKDCYDLSTSGELLECYDGITVDHSQLNLFGIFSVKSQDIRYTQHCHNCKHIFGCVGLKNSNYCIFNKQYTKEEYEELVPKIIKHMNDMPYVDKRGNIYKYGEFFPIELSPFGYNETIAPEQFFLSKEEIEKNGYTWQYNIQKTIDKETLKSENISDDINKVDDSILEEILCCIKCRRNYKIIQNELIFYKKMQIPIPRRCFYCRHANRIKRRNPFKLWHRKCMKEGCQNEFETSYSPDRPEMIYCEKCYQAEIY
ncbi:MAG: hypothetical protein WC839_02190 [Candidatus Paceibacterota bacterium]